jgi:hypothetical protein
MASVPTKTFRTLGPFPKPARPVPNDITRVIGGVRQAPKQVLEKVERRSWSHFFGFQLENALAARAAEEVSLYESGAFPDGLTDLVSEFHRTVCEMIDRTRDHQFRGAPPTFGDAKRLSGVVTHFKTALDQFPEFEGASGTPLATCMQTLCDDVEHYVRQIHFVYGIVGLQDRQPRLANRPTHWKEKTFFANYILDFQAIHGAGALPKPADIRRALSLIGHKVSPRTLRSWRQQVEKGTFDYFIQRQKRQ